MKPKFLALLLALVTVLRKLSAMAQASSNEEKALGEINVYPDDTVLKYLPINSAAQSQKYT